MTTCPFGPTFISSLIKYNHKLYKGITSIYTLTHLVRLLRVFLAYSLLGVILGVDFKDLVPKTPVKLEDLSGKIIAIDAYNAIYQFLAIIRQPDGTPLKDSTGKITSHLSGLFYRTSNLVEMGIKPIYVFDGIPPTLKAAEIERRRQVKVQAVASYEKAAAKGDTEKMRMFAQASTSMKDYMQEDSRRLLELDGFAVDSGAKRRGSASCPHD